MSTEEDGQVTDGYTQDGTVDLKGRPVLRSQRGGWKACSFIVVYEVFERMAYYGISANLVVYMTSKLHQGTVASSNNVTNWVGTVWMTPIIGAYIADAHLGRYWTFVFASAIYLVGMCFLTFSVSVPGASKLQVTMFYASLYILAIGTGGTKPNVSTIGADQFDNFDEKEKRQKLSFFNWWMFSIFFGVLFASTVLVYIQENVGWTLGYGLATIGLAISIGIFITGTPFYRHKRPAGSSLTRMSRVIFAALKNSSVSLPPHSGDLYELPPDAYRKSGNLSIESTPSLRFLNKAAVKTKPGDKSHSPWSLCTVTQVEETKQMLNMVPILLATFIPSTVTAQVGTLFIKQGLTLDRSIGSFRIPAASLGAFVTISMLVSVAIYDRFLVRLLKKWTGNPRGITLLQRMGAGIIIHILLMATASLVEYHRLDTAKRNGLVENGGLIPLTIFILLPQFILFGIADAFIEVAKIEFFYDQAPETMKSMGTSYSSTSLGIGHFISSFLLETVSRMTMERGRGWILNNLNASRLDLYYAFFSVLGFMNLIFFLVVAKGYVYKAEHSNSMDIRGKEMRRSSSRIHRVDA